MRVERAWFAGESDGVGFYATQSTTGSQPASTLTASQLRWLAAAATLNEWTQSKTASQPASTLTASQLRSLAPAATLKVGTGKP